MTARKPRAWRRALFVFAFLFAALNVIAALHAWRFTHFTNTNIARNAHPERLSMLQKAGLLLTGIRNSRPQAHRLPDGPYERVTVQSNVPLDCWLLPAKGGKRGAVLMLHGYGGEKSGMLDKAAVMQELGYAVLLPDMMGAGGSGGNQCTIGFREAQNVADCMAYLKAKGETPIILHGTSMGAAAAMKYLADGGTQPAGLIVECPFGTMYETICTRFRMMKAPPFPMAALLVFWGGAENGFWAFGHNPETYAKSVKCPALLIYGAKDDRVSRAESDAIYAAFGGPKKLTIFPEAGHNNYFIRYKKEWMNDVTSFIQSL